MTGKDKDYRYMATSDLLSELNKESFKAEQDIEPKLMNTVLQQLEDASGDVSGLAVKWYNSVFIWPPPTHTDLNISSHYFAFGILCRLLHFVISYL